MIHILHFDALSQFWLVIDNLWIRREDFESLGEFALLGEQFFEGDVFLVAGQ
jgi:hypothetical protein